MKKNFYNIFFVSVLCCGFSVHAQENEGDWVTCVDDQGVCREFNKDTGDVIFPELSRLISIEVVEAGVSISFWEGSPPRSNSMFCKNENFVAGRRCVELTGSGPK